MKPALALLVALCLAAPGALAQTPKPAAAQGSALNAEQAAIVQRVNVYFNSLADLQGDFMQISPNGEQSSGKFYLSRPGKIRFDYARPATLQLISDGTTVAVRDRKLNTQDTYFLSQTPLRVILAESVDLTKETKVLSVEQSNDLTTVVVEEKSIAGNGKLSVVFEGASFELRQWTVTDAQGQSTTVAIYNLEKGRKIDPQTFRIRFDNPNTPG